MDIDFGIGWNYDNVTLTINSDDPNCNLHLKANMQEEDSVF